MTPFTSLLGPRGWAIFLAIGIVLLIGVPILNLAVPPGSLLHIPNYLVPLLGKYACYAILALAMDLVWGYAGTLSLGHGAFFARQVQWCRRRLRRTFCWGWTSTMRRWRRR